LKTPAFTLCLAVLAAALGACHPRPSPGAGDGASDAKLRGEAGAPAKGAVEAATVLADDALPAFTSEELTTRAKHLLEAIQKDDGELAGDIVFPRDAYLAVKDVADPGKDWDKKVLAAFRSQVHVLHHRTKGIERAVFTSFELGQPATEALPKKHDLRRMLWRSKRSRLGFTIDGKPSHFDVIEMTGWRGAWYVTKLK
jgi:hypothetical protein